MCCAPASPTGRPPCSAGAPLTGQRWKDGAPFDADGPGTSDLDLTLVGDEAIGLFTVTGFFVPGVHSRPLSDEDPDVAPPLVALRQDLVALTKRPVNIQATRDHVRLDYVFVPLAHASRLRSCEVVREDPAREASDHFPLLARVDA